MSWKQFGVTNTYEHSNDSYYIKLFKDTTATLSTTYNIKIISNPILKRGNANTKERKAGIMATEILFSIKDNGRTISELLANGEDGEFKATVYKNGSIFFVGNLLLLTTKRETTLNNPVINLKIYDGLSRLKQFTDFSSFSTDLLRVTKILCSILNTLDFEMDIHIYQNVYKGNETASETILPVATNYARLTDYIFDKSNPSYFTVVEKMYNQFFWQIFQEDGVWIVRQVPSFSSSVRKTRIDYKNCSSSGGTAVTVTHPLSSDDLLKKALSFDSKKITRVIAVSPCYSALTLPRLFEKTLAWLNGDFKHGATGWNAGSSSPTYNNGWVEISGADSIYQESGTLTASQNIEINIKGVSVRVVQDATEVFNDAIVRIMYIDPATPTTYFLDEDGTWTTTPTHGYWHTTWLNGVILNGVYLDEYSHGTLDVNINVAVPSVAGYLRIELRGPQYASHGFPREVTLFNNCDVIIALDGDTAETIPSSLLVTAAISSDVEREMNIEIPFVDMDPYNTSLWYSKWNTTTLILEYFKVYEWETPITTMQMCEYIAKALLLLHQNNHSIDAKLLPGNSASFNNLIYGDLDGEGVKYYLPVFEESDLIADVRRFVILEHTASSDTVVTTNQYAM